MTMSHADCDHLRTPKARAACRKRVLDTKAGTAKIRVVPRTRGDGGVMEATKRAGGDGAPKRARKAGSVDLKRPGTRLRGNHDLADVPRVFMRAVNAAWEEDWEVIVGETFDHTSRRIIVRSPRGDINLAWSANNPNGLQRVQWRAKGQSIAWDSTLNGAIRLARGEEE